MSPPCAGSLSLRSHTLFSDALLIPPLLTNSALLDLRFVLFSHHPRTDRPRSQHKCQTGRRTKLPDKQQNFTPFVLREHDFIVLNRFFQYTLPKDEF